MSDNPNYWKLQGTIKELKEKDNRCFVCGSKNDIVPHHLKKVSQTSNQYYSEDNLVLLCNYHHHKYHHEYPDVNLKTFCEFLRDNFIAQIKEKDINKIKPRRGVKLDIDLNNPLSVSKLKKMMKLINKSAKKNVKISVDGNLYGVRNIRDRDDCTLLEIRGFKEGFVIPDVEKDNFVIHVDYNEDLKLSKFRKILNLVSKKNILNVSIKGELYNIIQIKDRENELIFVVDFEADL